MTEIKPCRDQMRIFLHVLFSGCSDLIACRSFPEKGTDKTKPPKPPRNIWIAADEHVVTNAMEFANKAAKAATAFYVIPATVKEQGQASSEHVQQMQTLLIDIDSGNTEEKLNILSNAIGTPTMIVESGGITAEGQTKLHLYWQLWRAVSVDDLKKLLELRNKIAITVGGDTHFKSAHQPIRVAGSVYHKGGSSKLVKIRSYEPIEYELEELIEGVKALLQNTAKVGKDENKISHIPFKQVLTSKVFAEAEGEATRFNHLQKVAGFWLRKYHDGTISREQAIEEIYSYNLANVVPPWSDDRLQQMIAGLWKKHLIENGEAKTLRTDAADTANISDNNIVAISPCNWQGRPPKRQWLIDGWLPRGYVTALYGDGGVGKSLLAQQLVTALSIGREFLGGKTEPCRVYALMCEDDENELWRRQVDINKHYNIDMSMLGNIRLVSRVGANNLLMTFANSDTGQLTEFFNKLEQDIAEYRPDLVILDTAADMFGGNENNRPQVRQFIQSACAKIARNTGGAVLLCAHPSESGIQKGTGSGGSTAWNNTVRSRWYLKRPEAGQLTEDHRILLKVKSNYSRIGTEECLKWENGAFIILDSTSCLKPITGKKQNNRNTAERDRKTQLMLKLIDYEAAQGRVYSTNQFAETFEDRKHKSYGFGSKHSIIDRLSVAATCGYLKFFNNPSTYGLKIRKSRYGYLCTDNTLLKGEIMDSSTGEVTERSLQVYPTHYKCPLSGELLTIENLQKSEEKK